MNKKINSSIAVGLVVSLLAQPASACTGIMLHTKDGSVVHGRTVEFGAIVDLSLMVVPRGYQFTGQTPNGDGLKYTAKYGVVGMSTYKDNRILDGMNEKGLASAGFWMADYVDYTPVTSANQSKGISPSEFPNLILSQFATVAEARQAIETGAFVITPTIVPGWGPVAPPFHYIIYDKSGAVVVVESIKGKLVVYDDPLGLITNSPTFDWHMTNLRNYISLNPLNVPPVKVSGETFKQFGQGSGMFGLPGDFTPPSRFVRAAFFSATAVPSANAELGVEQVFHILNNFDIPVGVAREEIDGAIHTDFTQMTMVRDPANLRYYWKTYDDQALRMVDLMKFDLNAKELKLLGTKSKQSFVDMTDQLK